ncbi:tetratricopeptide repeat protein [Nostoc sp. CCY 9925]|uniref:tetratricopeptide repeat protein n=1 Tax=Nostoc sp. CCY 9925 TaxID=3103865 RepID=UPI0039C6A9EE
MSFKIWQIAIGISLLVGLNGSQVALANVESNSLYQRKWLVADLSTDINDISIDIDTPEKEEWAKSFSELQPFLQKENFKDALPITEETIRIAEKTKDSTLITFSHGFAVGIYQELGQIQQAIKSCNSAISAVKLVRKSKGMRLIEIMLLVFLGELYNEQNDPKLALEALNTASNLLDKVDKNVANLINPVIKPTLLSYMGWAYNNAQDFSRGLQLTEEALQSLPEAERVYKSISENTTTLITPSQFLNTNYQRIVVLWQMGVAYEKLGSTEKACSVYKDTLSFVKQVPNSHVPRLVKKSIDDLNLGRC